jgi:coproporphyrinogen III oxidase-like Fe-S oxidoreductase
MHASDMTSNVREVELSQIQRKWLNKGWKDGYDTFNLYIHNPFCPSICSFCIHSGTVTGVNSDAYKRYYWEYLPKLFKDFEEVLHRRPLDTVYFGGGTASLMTEEVMEHIFSLIPNFKDVPVKVFEGHPVSMNKKKVDILAKYNFSYLTFGTQTFNDDVLKGQNRIPAKVEPYKGVIQHAKDKGLYTSVDILAFLEGTEDKDFDLVRSDLEYLASDIKPDIITVYPLRQVLVDPTAHMDLNLDRKRQRQEEIMEKGISILARLRSVLNDFIDTNPEWKSHRKLSLDPEDIKEKYASNYFLTTLDREAFDRIHRYNSSSWGAAPASQNVLALGGFAHDRPWSYMNRGYLYVQQNDNWNTRYFIKHDSSMEGRRS